MTYQFKELIKSIKNCRECKDYFGFEPRPVFGGDENARIIQISQAPSQNVHKTGKLFNDNSGKKLISEWYQIPSDDFYNGKNFYITAISHCYPGKNSNSGDRKPPKKCADKWLKKEIGLINNKLFVLIGYYATKYFFPNKKFTQLIFDNQKINNKPTIILPHPSPTNKKWFKNNPNFMLKKLPKIRKIIHKTLY